MILYQAPRHSNNNLNVILVRTLHTFKMQRTVRTFKPKITHFFALFLHFFGKLKIIQNLVLSPAL